MAAIVVVRDGVAHVASAIIYSWGYVGPEVEIECLPTSITSNKTIDRNALQHIAVGIPEITNYYIPAISRLSTGKVYLELVKETSPGYMEALPLVAVSV